MASNLTIPLMPGTEVLALDNTPPRQQFEYKDGKRSDTPRMHPVTGRLLYRARALLKFSSGDLEEVGLLLDSDQPLGGNLKHVRIDPATATLLIRPEDNFNLALTLTATLLPEKGAA